MYIDQIWVSKKTNGTHLLVATPSQLLYKKYVYSAFTINNH